MRYHLEALGYVVPPRGLRIAFARRKQTAPAQCVIAVSAVACFFQQFWAC